MLHYAFRVCLCACEQRLCVSKHTFASRNRSPASAQVINLDPSAARWLSHGLRRRRRRLCRPGKRASQRAIAGNLLMMMRPLCCVGRINNPTQRRRRRLGRCAREIIHSACELPICERPTLWPWKLVSAALLCACVLDSTARLGVASLDWPSQSQLLAALQPVRSLTLHTR